MILADQKRIDEQLQMQPRPTQTQFPAASAPPLLTHFVADWLGALIVVAIIAAFRFARRAGRGND